MKKLKFTEEEISEKYPGLPKKGDKFHNHKFDPFNLFMNQITDRYVIEDKGKKYVKIEFKYPDEYGEKWTTFEVYD